MRPLAYFGQSKICSMRFSGPVVSLLEGYFITTNDFLWIHVSKVRQRPRGTSGFSWILLQPLLLCFSVSTNAFINGLHPGREHKLAGLNVKFNVIFSTNVLVSAECFADSQTQWHKPVLFIFLSQKTEWPTVAGQILQTVRCWNISLCALCRGYSRLTESIQ